MNALRKVVLVLFAATLGYAFGMRSAETREKHSTGDPRHSPNGSVTVRTVKVSPDDATASALSALLARRNLRELARAGPLLDALDATQMGALCNNFDRVFGEERNNLLPRLLAYWTKRDPEGATAWMQPHLARFAKDPSFIYGCDRDLMEAWAENAPELAVEYAHQHAATQLGESLLGTAIFAWPDKNDAVRFGVLRDFPAGKERRSVIVSFFFSWAQTDQAAALSAAASLPAGPERDGGLGEVLAHWAASQSAAAFDKAQALGVTDPALLAIMVKEAAKSDPTTTAHWLETRDAALLAQIGCVVAKFWAEQDPAAAFAWAQAHGVSLVDSGVATTRNIRSEMFVGHAMEIGTDSPFSAAMREKPDATVAWVNALPPGPDRERYIEMAIRSGLDVADAQFLVAELPPEAAARSAALIAGRLEGKDPSQARQWVESLAAGPMRDEAWAALGAARTEPVPLPPGHDRDAMLQGMASARATVAPAQALERAMEIGDVALRRRTLDDVFWQLNRGRIDLGHGSWMSGASESALHAAHAWLEAAKIPEDWKQPWRQ